MCFGFLGLQFAFALQNANVSRIFQTLGASLEQVPLLWIAAPFTGLLVQPLIGYASDRTWTRLGRRRPYFLAGAVLAAGALWLMPRASLLWVAALLLWLLDGAINVSMEPFRAFVGDQLDPAQRPAGFAMQSFFIGVGAVLGGALPWVLAQLGISNVVRNGETLPATVRDSFGAGAVALLLAIGWTVLRSREYPPETLRAFRDASPGGSPVAPAPERERRRGLAWLSAGLVGAVLVGFGHLEPQLYLLCGGLCVWGLLQWLNGSGFVHGPLRRMMADLAQLPPAMRRLAPVQFFSWLALFAMWIYTTAAVTQVHFGASDPHAEAYNRGANWVGILFSAYNGFAALAALALPSMVRRLGLRLTHLVNVWLGAAGLLSFLLIRDPNWLLLSMFGVGCAWASILALPYALLSDSVPAPKMGFYMGVFNFFIVIPQLVAATVLGVLLRTLGGGAPIHALALGGLCFLLAGLLVLRVPEPALQAQPAAG
ncbi:MAG: MFS transporter [Gammaproteobacteria bacterium]|nr:MFS transporter [Gammaproteobacteria bacterium]MBV9697389.1 MFS transporter [Gammaproteobacteria bacterium]